MTALLAAPGVDEGFRADVVKFPRGDSVFGWLCVVADCEVSRANGDELCTRHYRQWLEHKRRGGTKPDKTAGPVPVILITYATTEDAVRRALAAVKRDRVLSGAPQVIRIEKN